MHKHNSLKSLHILKAVVSVTACACIFGFSQIAYAQTDSFASPANRTVSNEEVVWEESDFNIYHDPELGKMIGGRKNVTHPAENGKPAYTENIVDEGFSEKGFEKLKKSRHVVIPEGIQAIHTNAFAGSKNGKPDNFIETLKLPKSLKVIQYGAFAYNTIKGTIEIPEGVVYVGRASFIGNQIEKVILPKSVDGTGKLSNGKTYYLSGIGTRAFQANKISEIIVKGNLSTLPFDIDNQEKDDPNAAPFSNQKLGEISIEVGEKYQRPITITFTDPQQRVGAVEGFKENGKPVPIAHSSYFKQSATGEYIATKSGTLEGQTMLYDWVKNQPRHVAFATFTYKIVPATKIHTVTFVNETNQNYAKVQVKDGKKISDQSVANQVMPPNPDKNGYVFKEWNTKSDGTGTIFNENTQVTEDKTVYAIYTPKSQPLPQPQPPAPAPTPEPTPTPTPEPTPTPQLTPQETLTPKITTPDQKQVTPKASEKIRTLPQTGKALGILPIALVAVIILGALSTMPATIRSIRFRRRQN